MTGQPVKGKNAFCYRCVHFYITHAPDHPYGCRAMGFKSQQLPAAVVRQSSGLDCQLFSAKSGKSGEK